MLTDRSSEASSYYKLASVCNISLDSKVSRSTLRVCRDMGYFHLGKTTSSIAGFGGGDQSINGSLPMLERLFRPNLRQQPSNLSAPRSQGARSLLSDLSLPQPISFLNAAASLDRPAILRDQATSRPPVPTTPTTKQPHHHP